MDSFYGYDENVVESFDELGCAGDGCGTLVKFLLTFNEGRIIRASWWARSIGGDTSAHAMAAELAKASEGMTIAEAACLGHLNLPSSSDPRTLVAEDAFHHALGVATLNLMRAGHKESLVENSTLVAMSGGVDSAVCLHRMMRESAGNVLGCTLRLWIDPAGPDPDRACCAPDSVRRARHTCHREGKGHLTLDMRAKFKEVIVNDFIASYKAGETPNPCVRCNGHFRLDELVAAADALGFDRVATGHYVQLERRGDVSLVKRGVDPRKDQSYMLADVSPATLARYAFPLGADTKVAVRAEAAALGLEQAKIKGSQEVCFLGGGNYRDFLARAKASGVAGNVLLEDGTMVGSHDSLAAFTPGQRKGIPFDHARLPKNLQSVPLFVKATEPETGNVIVAPRSALVIDRVPLRNLKLYTENFNGPLVLQVRYRMSENLRGQISECGNFFELDSPILASAAPGQAGILFDGDTVIGRAFVARMKN